MYTYYILTYTLGVNGQVLHGISKGYVLMSETWRLWKTMFSPYIFFQGAAGHTWLKFLANSPHEKGVEKASGSELGAWICKKLEPLAGAPFLHWGMRDGGSDCFADGANLRPHLLIKVSSCDIDSVAASILSVCVCYRSWINALGACWSYDHSHSTLYRRIDQILSWSDLFMFRIFFHFPPGIRLAFCDHARHQAWCTKGEIA